MLTYLLAAKSDTFMAYQQFEAWARTQNHCGTIKVLHSDHGGEYLSEAFDKHLAEAGTSHQLTIHNTLQLNGIVERLNCTLIKKVWALLHMAGLPVTNGPPYLFFYFASGTYPSCDTYLPCDLL